MLAGSRRLPAVMQGIWTGPVSLLAAAVLVLALLTVAAPWPRLVAFLALGWWLPGWLLARAWRLPGADAPATGLAALGLGLGWLIGLGLLLHYLPGPIVRGQLLLVYGGGAAALGGLLWQRHPLPPAPADRRVLLWGAALLLVALVLRLPGLGYHEFHADEVVLLRQGERAIGGRADALAEHTKGPGEIVVAMTALLAVGTSDEGMARLPFALMSVGSILATAWLGRRLRVPSGRGRAGLGAGLLLAVNGFALGLSRIAQYQAAVLLLSTLAVWALWEFAQSGRPRWLALGAAFSITGLVMHYEFGLLAFALLLLLVIGRRAHKRAPGDRPAAVDRTVVAAALVGLAALAVAYVPPLLNDYFATTQGYLANRLGDGGVFNLSFFVEMGTFYNSTYFFVGLVLLTVVGTVMAARRAPLVAALLTLWWLPFFVLYIFVVRYPGTHFYLLMESWSLLAAVPLAALVAEQPCHAERSEASPSADKPGFFATLGMTGLWRGVAWAGVAVWLAVSVFYLYLLFFRQSPEYLVNIDRAPRGFPVDWYWAPFPTPEKPRFGFPIQAGWKTLGVLGQWGYFLRTYAANDDAWSLRRWYLTPYSKRDLDEQPDYIFVAHERQEPDPMFDDMALDAYTRVGEVRVRREPRIEIWAREPLPVPYVTFDAEQFTLPFRAEVASLTPPVDPPSLVTDVALDPTLTLTSAHVDATTLRPGDVLRLLLVWTPRQPLPLDYKLFVHVAGPRGLPDGRPLAQWDGYPGLNTARTSTWAVGEPFRDHVLLPLPDDLPPGDYTLLVGLYDPATGDRLGDRAVTLTTLTVR